MNVLATTAGEHMFNILVVFSIAIWAIGRLSKKVDGDGAIKKVAKQGFINMLSRWMK